LYWEKRSFKSIYDELITIKGVGPWTAEMFGMFYLLEKDIFPIKDIGIIRAMNQIYGEGKPLDLEKIIAISETWRPYRSVACWFLWRSIDSEEVLY
jgi:DNA-3-methyladenine glycosylase II